MEITDVQISLDTKDTSKVLAYCDLVIENKLVIHDIKLLLGENGPFVSMPSRKHKQPCWHCDEKVECGSKHCACCGAPGPHNRSPEPPKRFHDVAHPITHECREMIHNAIIKAYERKINCK